jgi:predicted esterase
MGRNTIYSVGALLLAVGLLSGATAIAQKQASAAGADFLREIPTWTKDGIIAGATSSQDSCSLKTHVWIVDGGEGFCIRFFTNDVKSKNAAAIFFFQGDFVGSDWDSTGHSRGVIWAHKGDMGAVLFKNTNLFVERQMGLPFVYLSRPGVLGSSGDHKNKTQPQESRVINAAIDSLKARLKIRELVLAGQSGGAALVANILPKRSDVKCAVMGSGAVALWQFASRFVAQDVYKTWEDPIQSAHEIGNVATHFYVLAGDGDKTRPPEYQKMYAQFLTDKGLDVHFELIKKTSGDPHDLEAEVLRTAESCERE